MSFSKINKRQPKYCKSTMEKTQKEEKWTVLRDPDWHFLNVLQMLFPMTTFSSSK